ncbi:Glucuronoyl esterase catalytic domain from Hypocrea Jecorina [Crassisporium funariophilum]|nr:Glucuronoyl esterase catalytic domain from Hypocrea Jecorina [Crassisporium funariophilum]
MILKYLLAALYTTLPVLAGPAPRACSALPKNITLKSDTGLPNPFAFIDGRPVETLAQWECRREEIGQLFQRFELGTLPVKPQFVKGTFTNGTLTINVTEAGKSISFQVSISTPTTGKGPFPAIIAFGGLSIPTPPDVAIITFNNNDIAEQQDSTSRGQGKFYTLYGADHSAGALMAWSWAISRIFDVLEETKGHNINIRKIGLTGCSRNGKGAYIAGAYEERVALTIVQESGSGGAGCWRISDDMLNKQGIVTQTASEIVQENVWFSENFNPYVDDVSILPFDHHMLAGLVAPRGLLVIDNTGIDWLGPESVWGCQTTGAKIYEALRVPAAMGVTQQGNHDHCALPAEEAPDVTAFINKFLKDQPADTTIMNTDGANNVGFVESSYVDWKVPTIR